jgi:hypothetical protein
VAPAVQRSPGTGVSGGSAYSSWGAVSGSQAAAAVAAANYVVPVNGTVNGTAGPPEQGQEKLPANAGQPAAISSGDQPRPPASAPALGPAGVQSAADSGAPVPSQAQQASAGQAGNSVAWATAWINPDAGTASPSPGAVRGFGSMLTNGRRMLHLRGL